MSSPATPDHCSPLPATRSQGHPPLRVRIRSPPVRKGTLNLAPAMQHQAIPQASTRLCAQNRASADACAAGWVRCRAEPVVSNAVPPHRPGRSVRYGPLAPTTPTILRPGPTFAVGSPSHATPSPLRVPPPPPLPPRSLRDAPVRTESRLRRCLCAKSQRFPNRVIPSTNSTLRPCFPPLQRAQTAPRAGVGGGTQSFPRPNHPFPPPKAQRPLRAMGNAPISPSPITTRLSSAPTSTTTLTSKPSSTPTSSTFFRP